MAKDGNDGKGDRDYVTILTIRVPVSLAERIDAAAAQKGENRSDFARRVLERAVARVEAVA